jgi:hypothetical protein
MPFLFGINDKVDLAKVRNFSDEIVPAVIISNIIDAIAYKNCKRFH